MGCLYKINKTLLTPPNDTASRIQACTAFNKIEDLAEITEELERRKINILSPYIAMLQGIRSQIHCQDVLVLKGLGKCVIGLIKVLGVRTVQLGF